MSGKWMLMYYGGYRYVIFFGYPDVCFVLFVVGGDCAFCVWSFKKMRILVLFRRRCDGVETAGRQNGSKQSVPFCLL